METRAPYALVGMFILAAIGTVVGFVYWLNNAGGLRDRTNYEIRFTNSVSGLSTGAAVHFNGVRVGEVVDLRLDSSNPQQVIAIIAVDSNTPIRPDTHVGLAFQGLTGSPVIALEGRSNMAPSPKGTAAPVLIADPRAALSVTDAARAMLDRFDALVAANSEALHTTLTNLSTFSAALARNSDRLDGIMSGLERLTGGGPAAATPNFYDLAAPRDFPEVKAASIRPFVVPEPTATLLFDTQKILVQPTSAEKPSFASAKWADNIPKLLQARIIQSFENAGLLRSVARPTDGYSPSYQLVIDIRNFVFSLNRTPQAEVEFSAKLITNDGRILDARIFREVALATSDDAAAAVAAMNDAFGKAVVSLVTWVSAAI